MIWLYNTCKIADVRNNNLVIDIMLRVDMCLGDSRVLNFRRVWKVCCVSDWLIYFQVISRIFREQILNTKVF